MALLNPYCTLAQVQAYIKNADSSIQSALEDAINAASRYIDRYKGRDYFEHDYSADPLVIGKFDGFIIGEMIWLPWPVLEITELTAAGDTWTAGTDFKQVGDYQIVSVSGAWPEGVLDEDCVQITGRFGWAQRDNADALDRTLVPAGIPEEISQACVQIAGAISRWSTKDVVGLDGQRTAITEADIPRSAFALLGARKIVV